MTSINPCMELPLLYILIFMTLEGFFWSVQGSEDPRNSRGVREMTP